MRGSRSDMRRRRSSLPAPAERRCGPGKPCSTVRACSRSLESAQQATDRGWMPFAATRCSNPARVQFHRNGFWRYGPRRLNLPDERSQYLGPSERRLPARRAGSDPAGSSFDHSQSRQHANDAGIVPAAVALRRLAAPVQFVGYCAAGNGYFRAVSPWPPMSARRTPSMNKCPLSRTEGDVDCRAAAHIYRRHLLSVGFVVWTFRKVTR
jgi:hypothetical protein